MLGLENSRCGAGAPLVSVVIATRNRWPLLSRHGLAAALRQEDVTLEAIVVDDGSTDETMARLAEVADPRVRVLRHEEPRGVASARNTGIAVARGEWLAFLDDDDIWSPRKLRTQVDAGAAANASFVYSGVVVLDERKRALQVVRPPDPSAVARLLLTRNVVPNGAIAKARVIEAAGGFDERLSYYADWDLWIRITRVERTATCPEPLVGYCQHGTSMTSTTDTEAVVLELEYLRRKHCAARAANRVEFNEKLVADWALIDHRRAGRRVLAARIYLRTALVERSIRNLMRSFVVLLGERAMERGGRLMSHWRTPTPRWVDYYR